MHARQPLPTNVGRPSAHYAESIYYFENRDKYYEIRIQVNLKFVWLALCNNRQKKRLKSNFT